MSAVAVGTGEGLRRKNRYDFVVVGGGPNGVTIAAYLAKWGFSVCVLEARPELGGGAEQLEPVPGYLIDPHASILYGAAAPAYEQLELGRYGFRMSYPRNLGGGVTPDGRVFSSGSFFMDPAARDPALHAEAMGPDLAQFYVSFMDSIRTRVVDLLRSIFWTPPYDERWGVPPEEIPGVQMYREVLPFFDDALIDMSLMEFLDGITMPDPVKACQLYGSWGQGPDPFWKGTALTGLAANLLQLMSAGAPVGGMHALAHSVIRCALAHGARMFVNAPVSEIVVQDGRATGVRVADDSVLEEKTVHADIAVISGLHVKQTFLEQVSGAHLSADFVQRVRDLSLKGGGLFVPNVVVSELPFYETAGERMNGAHHPMGMVLHATTEAFNGQRDDVYVQRRHPTDLDHYLIGWVNHGIHDRRARPGHYILTGFLEVPAPEDHADGPEAVNRASEEILDNMLTVLQSYAPNITRDKVLHSWVNTPYDSEFRNMAFVGGNWIGMRQSRDEWWSRKPLPELARYRTPVENLYLCNQTCYPGGLFLMAVPYNLMHILIEDHDVVAERTPEWWYPSPWHVTDQKAGTR